MARIICEVRPRFVFVENSPMLVSRGLGTVLGDLASMGFDAKWGVLGANAVGASHKRERIWIAANATGGRLEGRNCNRSQQNRSRSNRSVKALVQDQVWPDVSDPRAFGSNDGLSSRVDRLKAIGNGQVPLCAATAWKLLTA